MRASVSGISSSAKKLRKELGYLGGMPPTITPFVAAFQNGRQLGLSDPSVNALALLRVDCIGESLTALAQARPEGTSRRSLRERRFREKEGYRRYVLDH